MLHNHSSLLNSAETYQQLMPPSFLEREPMTQEKDPSPEETTCNPSAEEKQIHKMQQRLLVLEEVLDSVLRFIQLNDLYELRGNAPSLELDDLKKSFDGVISSFYENDEELRQLLVNVVTLSIQCWQESGLGSKVHLAEKSRLWKVYLDRGTYQTRTLDKYLTMESLPKRPNWKRVLRTANYVLQQCRRPSVSRSQLEETVSNLTMLVKKK